MLLLLSQLFNGFVIAYSALPVYWKWFNRRVRAMPLARAPCGSPSTNHRLHRWSATLAWKSNVLVDAACVGRCCRITPTTWILQGLATDQLGSINTPITDFSGS